MERILAGELLLIAYHDKPGGRGGSSTELDCGVAGAVLVDLALAGRIEVVDGKVSVLDGAPVGDREIDSALGGSRARIRAASRSGGRQAALGGPRTLARPAR